MYFPLKLFKFSYSVDILMLNGTWWLFVGRSAGFKWAGACHVIVAAETLLPATLSDNCHICPELNT